MNILTFPNSVLRKKSKSWDLKNKEEKEEVLKLIEEMRETMYGANGVGLAAPQVGVLKKIFMIDVDQKIERNEEGEIIFKQLGELHIFINPEIISKEGVITYEEGCLSVPGIYEEVERSEKIKVEFCNTNFEKQELDAEGLLAIAIQHEYDHLGGKLFIDRLPTVKRTMVKNRILKGKNL